MQPADVPARLSALDLVLSRIEALPTLPPVATRLMEIGAADEAEIDDVVAIIESDPALTARVLGMCRCAAHGLGDKITTVKRAVVMLGIDAVRLAVLGVAVYELMPADEQASAIDGPEVAGAPMLRLDRPGYWRHSIGTGAASQLIAEAHPHLKIAPDVAFTAGLLHGLGRLALDLIVPRGLGRALALAEQRRVDAALTERALIGMDHHTAGKRLAEHWGLPSSLRDVIWLHAQPASAIPELAHASLIGVVTVARAMSRRLHLGWSGDFSPVPDMAALSGEFGLSADEVLATGERVHEAVATRCAAIGLEEVTTDAVLMQSLAMANRSLARTGVALERRARQARSQGRILGAISAFLGEARPEDGVARTLGRVVASASSLLGEGFYGAIVQTSVRGAWRVLQIACDGRVMRDDAVDVPGDLSGLGADLTLESLGLLPWISDYALDAVDLRRVRLMRLGGSEEEGACVVLMHDRPADGLEASGGPLIAAWWSAVRASIEGERARRLGEELASANRALAHAQDQVAESRAMAHLGKVTAGAAHEMNNPLTIISGRAQLLAESLSGDRERAAAAAITSAAQDLSEMISSLNMLASPPTPRPAPVSIGAMVRSAIEAAEARVGVRGRVRARLAQDLPEGVLDRELMTRALAEIVVNALEASGDGIVEVRAQAEPDSGRLRVEVVDAGPGLSARALRHAFDPFFSEKPAGRQPGLGLARARQLVELHAGSISLRNNDAAGAVCTISLPPTPPSPGVGLMDAA